jgi:2,3-bisphosphoglycerate-independent phosphoglycerate mutase
VPVVFVFVDGVGAGAPDPAVNPLARRAHLLSRFADGSGAALPGGGRAVLADATLGVPGRPQSATGQTTILTGENAPARLGYHLVGFPNAPLRELLSERSVFRALAAAGGRGAFVNAFPVAYLHAIGVHADGEPEFEFGRRRPRASASTLAFRAGGGAFRTWGELRAGAALTPDLTGARARSYGADAPLRAPGAAAEVLLRVAAEHDLTLFEFFETDEAGHARSMDRALDALDRLDAFLRAVVEGLPPGASLVVASDHGNVEDLSIRNHTRAAVPVLGFGPAAERVDEVRDLTNITPLLLALAGRG